jgi:hypothetical protein
MVVAAIALSAVMTAIPALTAHAQAPQRISYQGVLTNDQGVPLDGSYNLTFKLYVENPLFGAASWTETQNAVVVTAGFFAVELGKVNPITLPMTVPYFLGISVNGGTELAPRTPLTSAPYALGLQIPFGTTVSTTGSALFIRNNGTGAAMEAVGLIKVGASSSVSGTLNLYQQGAANPVVEIGTEAPHGGRIRAFDESGNMFGTLEPDIDGSGGEFEVRRGVGQVGFQVDGNWAGTGQPLVKIEGSSRSVTFNMNSSGNGSVQLPADAVSASETLDEPGVANVRSTSTTTTGVNATLNLLTRSITVPAAGYIVATASAQIMPGATFGSILWLSVSDQSVTPGDVEFATNGPNAGYTSVASAQAVFQVSAGVHTLYLVGRTLTSGWDVGPRHLTLMYFPTAYGTTQTGNMAPASNAP